jgi:hypothetical protein
MAPATADIPGRHIQRSGTFGVEGAGHSDDVVYVVALGEASAEEDAAKVNVVGDVAAAELTQRHPEVAGEYLNGHGSLLLGYAWEVFKASAQVCGCWSVRPQGSGVSVVLVEDDAGCLDKPTGNVVHEPVEFGLLMERVPDGFRIGG